MKNLPPAQPAGEAVQPFKKAHEKRIKSREEQLALALEEAGLPARTPDQAVLHIVPARNIETWLEYLKGEEVDERGKKLYKDSPERDCRPMVEKLKAMCDAQRLREPAPASLERACTEYRTRMQ
ncbi:hypothetical protein [uncultured Thiodictyon sp.]|uniref:hypothetical protein n=1 Tax=uncultured Thiodictyon sp. TaxID=1846217 RepID=UPI0025DE7767|nr:hypothetical protein [uncultured Thiodictyon sp.]